MDLNSQRMPGPMSECLPISGRCNQVPRSRIDSLTGDSRAHRCDPRKLGIQHCLINPVLLIRKRTYCDSRNPS